MLRPRHDGWTPARQQLFLQALADTGSVSVAARRAGLNRASAYRLRRHPDAVDFRALWDLALADAFAQVPQVALERVLHGEEEVLEREGLIVAVRRRPAHVRLLLHMLKRAEDRERSAKAELAALQAFRDAIETLPDRADWVPSADAEHEARDAPYLPLTLRLIAPDDAVNDLRQTRPARVQTKNLQNQR
ncbi:hypothetical protein [Sandarakinorhabdus oryzae]|uniref:hypothetical protein n=1 Tax=Sandarakinorhabdus oryzae TaxID=2675220 RepID=UPI0012E0FE5B|nr:hypothetical protein [Sandarakinorhabdus oryzae]